ncbi:hypothetical protein HQ489_00825 [Candidatus Woesearchaeota archaeon]|nr:hypothetical protein [Candidatus Woesearchaeota archaeon]
MRQNKSTIEQHFNNLAFQEPTRPNEFLNDRYRECAKATIASLGVGLAGAIGTYFFENDVLEILAGFSTITGLVMGGTLSSELIKIKKLKPQLEEKLKEEHDQTSFYELDGKFTTNPTIAEKTYGQPVYLIDQNSKIPSLSTPHLLFIGPHEEGSYQRRLSQKVTFENIIGPDYSDKIEHTTIYENIFCRFPDESEINLVCEPSNVPMIKEKFNGAMILSVNNGTKAFKRYFISS